MLAITVTLEISSLIYIYIYIRISYMRTDIHAHIDACETYG